MTTPTICPICEQAALQDFLTLDNAPLHVGIVWPSKQAAQAAPSGTICLSYCPCCGFVSNRTFDAARMDYAPGYEVSLHHSPVYQAFVAATVQQLTGQYGLRGKTVLEVGCGRGYFLKELCHAGGNLGIGVDPSLDLTAVEAESAPDIRFVRDFYDDRWADVAIDCLACRHVLQHIPNPKAFVQSLVAPNAGRPGTLIYFELPNAAYVLETAAAWNVFYEHCSYLSPDFLRRLFMACNCTVFENGPCFEDGQYMNLFAAVGETAGGAMHAIAPQQPGQGLAWETVQRFGDQYTARVQDRRAVLQSLERQGKRIVAWGSGGRGVSFLNNMGECGAVEYVVDINPERQHKYIPGSGQQVIAPVELAQIAPDVIVLTNPTYAAEIRRMVTALGLAPEYMDA
jgi:SAM-dependent methyltransferase